jgi:hypothetical protein
MQVGRKLEMTSSCYDIRNLIDQTFNLEALSRFEPVCYQITSGSSSGGLSSDQGQIV